MPPIATPPRGARPTWSAVAAALLLSACATKPPEPPAPAPAPVVQTLEQTLKEAGDASTAGNREQARDLYRQAAKAYPAAKDPWLKLADDYMREDNHGHAVLAAQEVLQRDPSDVHAAGILTVAGLRLAASGIRTLRQNQVGFDGEPRSEAQKTAALLREITGEKELVPAAPPVAEPASAPRPAVVRRPAPRPPVAATPAPAPAPARPVSDNPFKPAR